MHSLFLFLTILWLGQHDLYAHPGAELEGEEADQPLEEWEESERAAALAFTQTELQQSFQQGLALSFGRAVPLADFGIVMIGKGIDRLSSFGLYTGSYEISGNLERRNYILTGKSASVSVGTRFFPLGFGPIFLEPFFGLRRWDGEVRPRGEDASDSQTASSLSSRYEIFGIDLGAQLGLMWIYKSGFFLEGNLLSMSRAFFIRETYTTNTEDARRAVRDQLGSMQSLSSLNFKLGWTKLL